MLNTENRFPQPGSAGLLSLDGSRVLARIQQVHQDGRATIFIGNLFGSSGTRRVPLAEIEDGTPLSDREEAELVRLERDMAGKARVAPKKLQRFNALSARAQNAPVLKALLDRHRRSLERQTQQQEPAFA